MKKFSNKDLQRIANLSHRQVIYLTEKVLKGPEIEEASGRGTMRLYSERDVAKILLAKTMRDAGVDFPALAVVSALMSGFFDELSKLLYSSSASVLTTLHFIDGRYGYLSTADGRLKTKVFEVLPGDKLQLASFTPSQVLKQGTVHMTVDLRKVVQKLLEE